MFRVPENCRVLKGPMGSNESYGTNGCFVIKHPKINEYFYQVIASVGMGFEHVSVTLHSKKRIVDRCPTWGEMCWIKDVFWDKTDWVVQYHPPESEYVNQAKTCLHLWRPTDAELPVPDSILVGFKETEI